MPLRPGVRSAARILSALLPLLFTASVAPAATPPAAVEDCPSGNLLRTATLVDSLDVGGACRLAIDDTVAVEDVPVTGVPGVRLETDAAALTFDLGRSVPIKAAFVQADGRSNYSLLVSEDGEHFEEIWRVPFGKTKKSGSPSNPRLRPPGMSSSLMVFSETKARFIRFGEPTGAGSGLVSEIQVYCDIPTMWPPQLATFTPHAPGPRGPHRFSEKELSRAKLCVALLGAGVLALGLLLERRRAAKKWLRLRDALLLVLGLISFWGYFNWIPVLTPAGTHYYEFYHYYIGSKYFPELGYTGLYDCTSLAEVEMGLRRRVEHRTIRDLRDNRVVRATYLLEDPERWKQGGVRPWTPARWEAFKKDIAYFQAHVDRPRWERILKDHGYNPSPVWNIAGSLLANTGPASEKVIEGTFRWIDAALVVLAFALIIWAFGWRVACIASLFFGTNDLGAFFWVGNAFLRMDWFFWTMAGLCFLKRGNSLLGGVGLGVAALLRIFPIGFLVPVVLRAAWVLYKERRFERAAVRILVGSALAAALLIPISAKVAGGWGAWPQFLHNTAKHANSPMTNNVGLRTVLGFQWETRQKVSYDPTTVDPFESFREARTRTFRGNLGLFAILGLGYLSLLLFAIQRERDGWVWAVFGFGVIPIGMELTCYYYSCLTAAAFLWVRRPRIALALILLSALGQVVSLGTFFYDIRFYFHSILVIAFAYWAALDYGLATRMRQPGTQQPGTS